MSTLDVRQMTAGYRRGQPVIREVSLTLESGQVGCIIGPNGAGKSTLVKAILGLCTVQSGSVWLKDADVTGRVPSALAAQGLGYVPQVNNVFPSLTVRENLEMGGWLRRRTVAARIDEVTALFPDLRQSLGRKAEELSGGQRNMLALARALMTEPDFVLLDEPTAGLAPIYVDKVWEQIARLAPAGVGVLIVEQNARRALEASEFGWVMVAGEVAQHGRARDILASEEVVNLYLGGEGRAAEIPSADTASPEIVTSQPGSHVGGH